MKKTISAAIIVLILLGVTAAQQKVIHFKKLQEFLPEKIAGFERGRPQGSTSTAMGISTSEASVEFYNEESEQSISISIADISGTPYAGAAMMYQGMDFETEDEDGYEKTVTLDGGYKAIEKAQTGEYKSCELDLILDGRFSISVSGNGFDDASILRQAVKGIDLKKLESATAE